MRRPAFGVILSPAPEKYDVRDQTELRRSVELAYQRVMLSPIRQIVTGSKDGNTALASLITALANLGWVEDQTT